MRLTLAMIVALVLAGCTGKETEVVTVLSEPAPLPTPAECNPWRDPKWTRLPDAALKKSDIARTDAANGRAFDTLTGKRRDCWSVLTATKRG